MHFFEVLDLDQYLRPQFGGKHVGYSFPMLPDAF
jgi:hypothetical protein